MAKRHIYNVEVIFKGKRSACAIGTKKSGYLMSGGKTATFEFKKEGFIITAERSSIYTDGNILSSYRNGLYGQLIKGLLVYYALSPDFPRIKSISIIRKRKKPYGDVTYSETAGFRQPITPHKNRALAFSLADIDELLNETPKGYAVRAAMTYWLKAANSTDLYFRFDRYWRAYDRLLLYEGNGANQKDSIVEIKKKISANEALFIKSKALINTYSDAYIRSFSWNHLLYSRSKKYKLPQEIARRAMEYIDSRSIRLYKHLLNGKKINAALVTAKLRANVDAHFAANVTTKKDIDVVLLMSLSYTYYIRCRMFHGETPDSTFKLKSTNEDREIEELVKLLELVTFELLENNKILR